jgi:hypothetical protein
MTTQITEVKFGGPDYRTCTVTLVRPSVLQFEFVTPEMPSGEIVQYELSVTAAWYGLFDDLLDERGFDADGRTCNELIMAIRQAFKLDRIVEYS